MLDFFFWGSVDVVFFLVRLETKGTNNDLSFCSVDIIYTTLGVLTGRSGPPVSGPTEPGEKRCCCGCRTPHILLLPDPKQGKGTAAVDQAAKYD